MTRLPRILMWILLVLVLCEFVFVAYPVLLYSPLAGVKFAFSGEWLKKDFRQYQAGLALDMPTVGKFFLWTSYMSYLACSIILVLHTLVAVDRRAARRCVTVIAALLVALVLNAFLSPTFLLIQYVLTFGLTDRRIQGFLLCCGFWVSLPAVVFWIRKPDSSLTKWSRTPIAWAFACSAVAPLYYILPGLLNPSAWRHWNTRDIVFMIMFLALLAPFPCIMLLRAWGGLYSSHRPPSTGH